MNVDGIGAIVVGGAHGLGAMIARALGDAGADVSIFDIDGAKAAEVAAVFGGYSQLPFHPHAMASGQGITTSH